MASNMSGEAQDRREVTVKTTGKKRKKSGKSGVTPEDKIVRRLQSADYEEDIDGEKEGMLSKVEAKLRALKERRQSDGLHE